MKIFFIFIVVFGLFCGSGVVSRAATYSYDEQMRLVQVVYDSGATLRYVYDATGNRLSETATTGVEPTESTAGTAGSEESQDQ